MTDVRRSEPVVLADGTPALVRLLRDEDRAAVTSLFGSTCDENLYTRFFTLGRTMIPRHIDHIFNSSATVTTYVVEREGQLLGIADVEECDATTAEIAFLVEDHAHGMGIATLLLERAADDASGRGVTTFVADVLAVNHPMIEVFRDAGFQVELVNHHGDVSVRMSTRATAATDAASHTRHELAHSREHSGSNVPLNAVGQR